MPCIELFGHGFMARDYDRKAAELQVRNAVLAR